MQTFLPYPDFRKSLECLDNKRLGKQRVEAMQLLNAINGIGGWKNHPAALMWKGNSLLLADYMNISIDVWTERGFKNTMKKFELKGFGSLSSNGAKIPSWLGDPAFHASHRSNLLRKDPVHYGQFGWTEPNDLPYVWPSKIKEVA